MKNRVDSESDSNSANEGHDEEKEKYYFLIKKEFSIQSMKDSLKDFDGLRGIFDFVDIEKDSMKLHSMKKYFEPVGLPNLGNTCYMNSLVQALTGCKLFMDYIKRLWKYIEVNHKDDDSVLTFNLIELL
jgi:ubiquitin C-terminal hydrolase